MATIIDALVVTLGIDPTQYKRGQVEASTAIKKTSAEAERAAKEMEARGAQAAAFFTKIRNEALALLAVFTAGLGIKNFTESTILTTASLGRMSANLGMSAKDLAEWQLAAKNAGGSAEGITSALQNAQQEVAKFKMGISSDSTAWFLRRGGKVSDILKGPESYLLARSRIISQLYKTDPGQAQLAAQQMGIGQGEFNLLKEGPEAVEKLRQSFAYLADEQARAAVPAERLRRGFDELENKFTSVGTNVLVALLPSFEKIMQWLQKLGDWIIEHKDDIAKWVEDTIAKIQKNAPAIKAWVDNVVGDLERIAPVAERLFTIIGNILEVFMRLAGLDPIDWKTKMNASGIPTPAQKTTSYIDDKVSAATAWFNSKTDGDGQARAKAALTYFQSHGWTREQAAGIVGSVMQESRVDPTARNKTSGAYGIGQWLGDRVAAFKAWSGHDLKNSTFDEQLGFMQYELTKGAYKKAGDHIRAATSAADAAAIHSNEYEIPGVHEAMIAQRQANAARLLADTAGGTVIDPKIIEVPAALRYPIGAAAQGAGLSSSISTSSSETHINGPINITTQATDAKGIAAAFGDEVKKYRFSTTQANTGIA